MTDTTWTWARLDPVGLELVREAERTIGADVVLVYAEGEPSADERALRELRPAPLGESQLECLRGMEQRLGSVAVAYRRA